ncbi:hypothetical protein C8R45DRAFT_355856 [Mycena sanguinolenta]|nr:hypothetical protein C8R45DRAFT_355856 [Mycena sanguinolenta]
MFLSYFLLFLLFASLLDADFVEFSPTFQGDWVNGNETALPNAQTCGSVTQTPGSSITVEPQGVVWFVLYGLFPSDPTTITAELDGQTLPLTPIATTDSTGCNNLLYNITLDATNALQNLSARAIPNLTFTFAGPASNDNFFAINVPRPSTTAPATSSTTATDIGTNLAAPANPSSTSPAAAIPSSASSALPPVPVTDTPPQSSTTAAATSSTTAKATSASSRSIILSSTSSASESVISSTTSSVSAIPSSTSPALHVVDTRQSSLSKIRAKLGGGIGGTIGLVALLAAVASYLSLKAPAAGASPDYEFEFLAPGGPITFRGKKLRNVQITIVLKAADLVVTDKIPGAPSTSNEKLTSGRDDVQVAWKVITLSVGNKPTLVDQDFFCFAPPRTLVTRTKSWKHAMLRDRTLAPTVLAKNAAGNPEDFALGTFHIKPSHSFYPFLVIRGVHDGQLCVAPQCEDLSITAYITENIQERQILYEEFYESGPGRPIVSLDAPSPEEESDLAPQPIDTEDADEIRKILSPPLMGESGKPISDLQQRTRWRLVEERGELRLSIVETGEV